jgi:hypothetical protein
MKKFENKKIILGSFILVFSLSILYFATYNYRLNTAKEKMAQYINNQSSYEKPSIFSENNKLEVKAGDIVFKKVFLGWEYAGNDCRLNGCSPTLECSNRYKYTVIELNYSIVKRKISDC